MKIHKNYFAYGYHSSIVDEAIDIRHIEATISIAEKRGQLVQ